MNPEQLDKIARAILEASRMDLDWDLLVEHWGPDCFKIQELRAMAKAAVEALELTEEWSVWYDEGDGFIDPDGFITDEREEAEEEAATNCQSCDHCRNALPKHVISRLVSPWARSD